jgi:hypothetical protein
MTEVKWHAVVIQTKDAEEPPSSHVIRYNSHKQRLGSASQKKRGGEKRTGALPANRSLGFFFLGTFPYLLFSLNMSY